MGRFSKAVCLLALVIAFTPMALAQGTYTQIDYPGSISTEIWGMNLQGDVVGSFWDDNNTLHGFILSAGVFTLIDGPDAISTNVYGINDVGQALGQYITNSGFSGLCGFLYTIQTQSLTSFQYSSDTQIFPHAINNAGTVAGAIFNIRPNTNVAFELTEGSYTILTAPGQPHTAILSLNNSGDALVEAIASNNTLTYFLLKQGKAHPLNVPSNIFLSGINDVGGVVGTRRSERGRSNGLVIQDGVRQSIRFPGSLSTLTTVLNDAGLVAGYFIATDGNLHGFTWTPPADAKSK